MSHQSDSGEERREDDEVPEKDLTLKEAAAEWKRAREGLRLNKEKRTSREIIHYGHKY